MYVLLLPCFFRSLLTPSTCTHLSTTAWRERQLVGALHQQRCRGGASRFELLVNKCSGESLFFYSPLIKQMNIFLSLVLLCRKVCSSRACSKKSGSVPNYNHADSPEECVFGAYRKPDSGKPSVLGSPVFVADRCNKNGLCSNANCVGNCCEGSGKCPTSSCIANALGLEERNCPKSARCPVRGLNA
jgi:hypothetical protein